jgi:hypothetical protein
MPEVRERLESFSIRVSVPTRGSETKSRPVFNSTGAMIPASLFLDGFTRHVRASLHSVRRERFQNLFSRFTG